MARGLEHQYVNVQEVQSYDLRFRSEERSAETFQCHIYKTAELMDQKARSG